MLQHKYLGILKSEKVQLGVIYLSVFLIPFLLPKPQIILGTIINFILIYSSSRHSLKQLIPLFLLPSISSFLNSILFGSSTIFLLYLIPFISISNFTYAYISKRIKSRYVNILIAACTKAFILYFATYILVKTTNLPQTFLVAMGGIQLITALAGGILATLFQKDTSAS
ncbi:MAG: hypothetical protein PHE21_04055 [Candidatus Dojkabacteria bacterium]|nr:hypothetical protein [Candidatus Dojkabacteria bacterium]